MKQPIALVLKLRMTLIYILYYQQLKEKSEIASEQTFIAKHMKLNIGKLRNKTSH